MRLRVAVLFDQFGPYHAARLRASAQRMDVVAIEVAAASHDYAWDSVDLNGVERVTLVEGDSRSVSRAVLGRRMVEALRQAHPDVVAVHGWGEPAALHALRWAAETGTPTVIMSESQATDAARSPVREAIKRSLLSGVGAALVGGTPHAAYAARLGIPRSRIFEGYDAVDNDHFSRGAAAARADEAAERLRLGLPARYVVASSRFVPKKNLSRLLEAFAAYRQTAGPDSWKLVLLGDGPAKEQLHQQVESLGLTQAVVRPGFVQYDQTPLYYGLAEAFIHASTTEQWGLVVNEAMASGLPVIVSNRCGCTPDLVHDGINGFTFDPYDTATLADLLYQVAHGDVDRAAMAFASRRLIADWGPERFASSLSDAAHAALNSPLRRATRWGRVLMRALAYR